MKLPCLRMQQRRPQLRKEVWMMLDCQTDLGTDTPMHLMPISLLSSHMAASHFGSRNVSKSLLRALNRASAVTRTP